MNKTIMGFNDEWKSSPQAKIQQDQKDRNRQFLKRGAAGLAVAIVLGGWLLPPNVTDRAVGIVKYLSLERACLREHLDTLKDPYSAYVVSSEVRRRESEPTPSYYDILAEYPVVVEVEIKAKNGFGAYGTEHLKCPVKDGRVDSDATFLWRLKHKDY